MQNEQLWNNLKEFSVDDGTAALSFIDRLARDNGWTSRYAQQVFNEYLRFVYLTAISNTPCTPSDEVDQAWHLHLAYSRSYWVDLCKNTLGIRLHHGPTKGGRQETQKYFDAYAETLNLYSSEFKQSPPNHIWPSPAKRFQNVENFRRLNTSEFFLIRKRSVYAAIAGVGALIVAPAAHAEWTFIEAVLAGLAIVIGLPLLFVCILWIVSRAKNSGGRGGTGSGCSGCGGCGGCGG